MRRRWHHSGNQRLSSMRAAGGSPAIQLARNPCIDRLFLCLVADCDVQLLMPPPPLAHAPRSALIHTLIRGLVVLSSILPYGNTQYHVFQPCNFSLMELSQKVLVVTKDQPHIVPYTTAPIRPCYTHRSPRPRRTVPGASESVADTLSGGWRREYPSLHCGRARG